MQSSTHHTQQQAAVPHSPKQRYHALLADNTLLPDPRQAEVVSLLDQLWQDLLQASEASNATSNRPRSSSPISQPRSSSVSWWKRLFGASEPEAPSVNAVRGLYLWGGVGRGKTFLCDLFFDTLPLERKQRLHFHRFMQLVHERLNALGQVEDTVTLVADQLARDTRVLVLDEMHINDITDAMIMGGLLEALFARGVTVVTTSNVPPSGLYKDGLQRANFLPAIALLETHTQVVNLDSDTDYRLRVLSQADTYHTPLGSEADQALLQAYGKLSGQASATAAQVSLNQREVSVLGVSGDVVWFEFEALCGGPRSTADYIDIARCYHTVLLSNVPVMDQYRSDEARRFLNLIDEFYDRSVKVIISAQAPADSLYTGSRLAFEFQRCASRLQEMQTHDYLQREHLP